MITKYEGIESETYYWWIFTRKIKLYFEKKNIEFMTEHYRNIQRLIQQR